MDQFDETDDGGAIKLVNNDGTLTDLNQKWITYMPKSGTQAVRGKFKPDQGSSNLYGATPTARLKVTTVTNNQAASTANWLRGEIETSIKGTLQQIVQIHDHLQNTMPNTREYTATKAAGKGASNYIDQVASDMKDAREKMNSVFNVGEGTTGDTYVTESKIKSLDDLIAETIRDIKRKRKIT